MKTTTRIKVFLKKNTPTPIFKTIRFIADKTLLKVLPLFFRVRISNFKKRYFKEICFENFAFQIEIDPENGYLDAQIHAHGLYEPHIVKKMKENVRPGDTCIDIGANIGHHTILLSHFVGDHGKVFAYEPIPKVRDQMLRSLAVNEIHNVIVRDVALSDSKNEMALHIRKGNIGGSSLVSGIDTQTISINVTTLDTEDIKEVNFMKIDVEGYEYHVLLGGQKLIEKFHPTIIFEWSPIYYRVHNNNHTKAILQFLAERSYRLYDIENGDAPILDLDSFIAEFNEGFRSQTNILAVAI